MHFDGITFFRTATLFSWSDASAIHVDAIESPCGTSSQRDSLGIHGTSESLPSCRVAGTPDSTTLVGTPFHVEFSTVLDVVA